MPWNRPLTHPAVDEHPLPAHAARIMGSGEMADRLRAFDWARTPLGPIASWSNELVAVVNLTLASPVPARTLWGPDLILIYNDQYKLIPGKRHPDALGRPARDVYRASWHVVGPLLEDAYKNGTTIWRDKLRVPIETERGVEDFYLNYTYSPVFERGRVAGLFGQLLDVTNEVRAMRALRENEARSWRVLESIGDAVIVTDAEGNVSQMNSHAEALTGWSREDARDRPLDRVFRTRGQEPYRRTEPQDATARSRNRDALQVSYPMLLRKDGAEIAIEDNASPIYDDDENVMGSVRVFRDVEERRAGERERHELANQLALVLDATTDGVLSVDRNWRMVYRNRRAQQMLQASGELTGRNFWETFQEALYPGSPFVENYYRTMDEGVPTQFEAYYPAPHNAWFAVDAEPAGHGVVIFFRDITAQKLEAEALQHQQAKLKAIYSTSLEYVGLLSPEGIVLECNRTALEFADMAREDVLGKHFADCPWFAYTAGAPDAVRAGIAMTQKGERFRRELSLTRPNGESIQFDFSLTPVLDEGGNVIYIVPEGRDITELKRAESALLKSEKLAAVGRLASSIAHEINNPLESVMNLIYLARTAEPEQARGFLDIADQEIRRVSIIANQTLRFHKQASNPQATTAGDLFATVMSIYEGRLRNAHVAVEKNFRETEPVTCFQGDVRQVLNNLVSNALEAMPFGGRLVIRSRKGRNWRTGEPGLVLTIADNGGGIPRDVQKHIFEAFYTTKGTAGNGLGLWVCQEIVARHNGALRVRSCTREGRSGTTFTLFLPFKQSCEAS